MSRDDKDDEITAAEGVSASALVYEDVDAPFIRPDNARYDGHFSYQFTENNGDVFRLGNLAVTKTEALVRLGVMPDNNIVTNKVINQLGNRVLTILRNAETDRPKEDTALICRTIPNEAELVASWAMIDILSAVKPLEKLTGMGVTTDAAMKEIKKVEENLQTVTQYFEKYFENSLPKNNSNYTFIAELDRKLYALVENCKNQLTVYKNMIQSGYFRSIEDHQVFHRDLLRHLMNDFEELQADISIKQRGITNLFSIANGTNTTTTQNAYYAIQNHIYSAQPITDAQLWIPSPDVNAASTTGGRAQERTEEGENDGLSCRSFLTSDDGSYNRQLNTAHYSGIKQQDALFAACVIENFSTVQATVPQNVPAQTKLQDAKKAYKEKKQDIKKTHTALKTAIDKARGGILGYFGLFRDSAVQAAKASESTNTLTQQAGWTRWHRFTQWLSGGENTQKNIEILKAISPSEATNLSESSLTDAFALAQPAYLYKPGDLFSAVSNFGYEVGEYFSRELSAKHPGLTAAAFIVPSIYMTSLAMANMGVATHTMQTIYTTMSKILSVDSKLVNPDKITAVFKTIDSSWQWLIGYRGFIETFLLTSLGGPKMIYLITEQINKMVSDIPETSLQAVQKLFDSGKLDVQLPGDTVREKIKTLLIASAMLGVATGLGVGISLLPSNIPGAAVAKGFTEMFDNVNAATLGAVGHSSGLIELGHIAQAMAEAKTAGIFIAKISMIKHFVRVGHEGEDAATIRYFQKLKDESKNIPPQNDQNYEQHKAALEEIIRDIPAAKNHFSVSFLNQHGVRDLKKPPMLVRGITSAGKVIGGFVMTTVGGALMLPYFIYRQFREKPEPDSVVGLYLYKLSAKLLLGVCKFVAMGWYGVKFFGQAILGFAGRVSSGLWEVGKTAINTVAIAAKLLSQGEVTLTGKYLLSQTAKAALLPVRVVQMAAKVAYTVGWIVASPLIAIAAVGFSAATHRSWYALMKDSLTGVLQSLSSPAKKMEDTILQFEKTNQAKLFPQTTQAQATANTGDASATAVAQKKPARHYFIRAKNAVGSALSWLRDHTMRPLERTLQVATAKQEALWMGKISADSDGDRAAVLQIHTEVLSQQPAAVHSNAGEVSARTVSWPSSTRLAKFDDQFNDPQASSSPLQLTDLCFDADDAKKPKGEEAAEPKNQNDGSVRSGASSPLEQSTTQPPIKLGGLTSTSENPYRFFTLSKDGDTASAKKQQSQVKTPPEIPSLKGRGPFRK